MLFKNIDLVPCYYNNCNNLNIFLYSYHLVLSSEFFVFHHKRKNKSSTSFFSATSINGWSAASPILIAISWLPKFFRLIEEDKMMSSISYSFTFLVRPFFLSSPNLYVTTESKALKKSTFCSTKSIYRKSTNFKLDAQIFLICLIFSSMSFFFTIIFF